MKKLLELFAKEKKPRKGLLAIEKGAKIMNVPSKNMYMRLKKQGLIHNFLLPYYEELHTQSSDWVARTTVETLKNWEMAQ